MDRECQNQPAMTARICAALLAVALVGPAGCGRAGDRETSSQPVSASVEIATTSATTNDESLAQVRLLLKQGRFDEFVDAALAAAESRSDSAALQLLKSEALLAVGRSEEAEAAAQSAAALALRDDQLEMSVQGFKLWGIARFRRQQPIDGPFVDEMLASLPPRDPAVEMLRFWRDALAHQVPYRVHVEGDAAGTEVTASRSRSGSVSADLNAIEVRANGVSMPLAFIDTGAQHTLMTVEAARAAGVEYGSSKTLLVGFAKLAARAGVLKKLELGRLTVEDVPVLVGDSTPLLATHGQMALGTELMHHVRLTIDYPHGRVFADRGDEPAFKDIPQGAWQIPLWTFSQLCLAEAQVPPGGAARVLIDTGDWAGTFISARWARRHLPRFERPDSNLIFKMKQRDFSLDELALGNQVLFDWPVNATMPRELERLDVVDILLGHDLLWPYQLTIDMGRRVMVLQSDPKHQPASPTGRGPG
jgi:predicted aspartyl protease